MSIFHQPPAIYVNEVNIKVSNLLNSIQFYKDIIGLKVLAQTETTAKLSADGKTTLVSLKQIEHAQPKSRTAGLYHFALLLPSRKSLSVFLRHLVQTGYPFGAGDHLVSEALYLDDPDGNGIEVYSDRPESKWVWKEDLVVMSTEHIDARGILQESQSPWEGLPAETIMGHIHLHVSNLNEAKEFYTKGLGFDVVSHYPQAIFMSSEKYHHHIAINTWAGIGVPPTPENGVGLNWYEIVYPNETERKDMIHRLQSLGYNVLKESNYYVTKDPSGNQIRLTI
jgi:catechol 2,3-dioxygenase